MSSADTFAQVAFFIVLFAFLLWSNQRLWRGMDLRRLMALLGAWVMVGLLILLAYKLTR